MRGSLNGTNKPAAWLLIPLAPLCVLTTMSDNQHLSAGEIEAGDSVKNNVELVEAPVTAKAYMACAFAAFGGIFFGYDMGYIAGVMGMDYVINLYTGLPIPGPGASAAEIKSFALPSSIQSLITSILSAGTFFGAIIAGDLADYFGRRTTIIAGCGIFIVGCILQVASTGWKLLVAGRAIAGVGVGFESAIVILYMSEIAPRKIRGMLVSGYQFCITIGLLVSGSFLHPGKLTGSSRLASTMALRTAWMQARTAFPLVSSLPGLLSSPSVSSCFQSLPDTLSSVVAWTGPVSPLFASVASLKDPSSRTNCKRSWPTLSTSDPSCLPRATLLLGQPVSLVVSVAPTPTFVSLFLARLSR